MELSRLWRAGGVVFAAAFLASCGGDPGGTQVTAPEVSKPSSITAVTGPTFVGTAGVALPETVTVRVITATGAGVANVSVSFTVRLGGGAVSSPAASTDAGGKASVIWTLGRTVGKNALEASAGGLVPVEFNATGNSGAPAALVLQSQPASAHTGATLSVQAVLAVQDANGNLASQPAVQVSAAISTGPGQLIGTRTVTSKGGFVRFTNLEVDGPPGAVTLQFSAPGLSSVNSAAISLFGMRALADRPDDVQGAQIHLVYALPSDAPDRGMDTTTSIAYSWASISNWMASVTNGRTLRLDTYHGIPDITFFQISRTDASMQTEGAFFRDEIERQLKAAGLVYPNKVYLVYYDGGSGYACGSGAWPPYIPGIVGGLYLRAQVPGYARCDSQGLATSPTELPHYQDFAAIHEIFHTLGAVDKGAPHHTAANPGHVGSEPNDLMYGGPSPWVIDATTRIDFGGDDYFGTAVPAALTNLWTSPFVMQVPASTYRGLRQPPRAPAPVRALPPVDVPFRLLVSRHPALRALLR